LMILVGGEFGFHCNAKGSEEECFCTHLSWFGTHDPCLLLSTSYETYSFFTSKNFTSPSRNSSSSLRKFLQGYFVWKKMEVFSGVKWWKILYLKAYIQWAAVELSRNCERELEAKRVVTIKKNGSSVLRKWTCQGALLTPSVVADVGGNSISRQICPFVDHDQLQRKIHRFVVLPLDPLFMTNSKAKIHGFVRSL
jgi:hypothetical protein